MAKNGPRLASIDAESDAESSALASNRNVFRNLEVRSVGRGRGSRPAERPDVVGTAFITLDNAVGLIE
jgi:hypothetical protein